MGRDRRSKRFAEPATPSQAALAAWLRGPPRRSQMLLAVVCQVSQPLVSAYATRRLRPDPESEAARLLEIATAGLVARAGWLTPDEQSERDARSEQAEVFARRVASGARIGLTTIELPTRRRHSSIRREGQQPMPQRQDGVRPVGEAERTS